MKLNLIQISNMIKSLEQLKDTKMSFKLGLILARNISMLEKEYNFYLEQEREFAIKYIEIDNDTQQFKQIQDGIFQIKPGLQEECQNAYNELNNFEVNIDLHKIPISLIENMDLTPTQISGLELIIEEEE